MTYYTLYEKLRALKESHREITILEINEHIPIVDIHEMTIQLLGLLPTDRNSVVLFDHTGVDVSKALPLLNKIRDEKLSIVKIFGPNCLEAFETFKSKYESSIQYDVLEGIEKGDQEIIFACKTDGKIKDKLTSLSTLPTYISNIGLNINDYYSNGNCYEGRKWNFTFFEYLQSFHIKHLTISSLYLASLLLDLKEMNEEAFEVLALNQHSTFVQSLLRDIKPEARRTRYRKYKKDDEDTQMMQHVQKIVESLEVDSYINYTYDFVRDYLI